MSKKGETLHFVFSCSRRVWLFGCLISIRTGVSSSGTAFPTCQRNGGRQTLSGCCSSSFSILSIQVLEVHNPLVRERQATRHSPVVWSGCSGVLPASDLLSRFVFCARRFVLPESDQLHILNHISLPGRDPRVFPFKESFNALVWIRSPLSHCH